MSHKIYRPTRWDSEDEWAKYIASRIEWAINLSDYGINIKQLSVSLSKEKDYTKIHLDGFLDSESIKEVEINTALYDNRGNIKDSYYLIWDVVKGNHYNFSTVLVAKDLFKFDKIFIGGIVREAVDSDMVWSLYLWKHQEFCNLPKFRENTLVYVSYNRECYFGYEGPEILDELRVSMSFLESFTDLNIDVSLYDDDGNIKDSKNIQKDYVGDWSEVSCVLKAKNILKLNKIVISGTVHDFL